MDISLLHSYVLFSGDELGMSMQIYDENKSRISISHKKNIYLFLKILTFTTFFVRMEFITYSTLARITTQSVKTFMFTAVFPWVGTFVIFYSYRKLKIIFFPSGQKVFSLNCAQNILENNYWTYISLGNNYFHSMIIIEYWCWTI